MERPNAYRTTPDSYGVLREYQCGKPSITPDELYSITAVSDSPYLATDPEDSVPMLRTDYAAVQKRCGRAAEGLRKGCGRAAEGLRKTNKKDLASTYVLRLRIT